MEHLRDGFKSIRLGKKAEWMSMKKLWPNIWIKVKTMRHILSFSADPLLRLTSQKTGIYVSQDLTFLYLVGLPYQSSRPMRWAPHPNVCGKCPLGARRPRLQSRVLCLQVVTSLWLRACVIQCPRPSYKRGHFGPASQSVFDSWVDHTARFLAVTFPGLCRMRCPCQTTHYTIVWVHLFSNVRL